MRKCERIFTIQNKGPAVGILRTIQVITFLKHDTEVGKCLRIFRTDR